VSMIVKGEGRSGHAKTRSDEPKHALGLVHYLRTIRHKAWIEDQSGTEIEETALKTAPKLPDYYVHERSFGSFQLPDGMGADKIEANLEKGVLTLMLPPEAHKAEKRITVESA
jgi:Hsp20/alpha crystallin family